MSSNRRGEWYSHIQLGLHGSSHASLGVSKTRGSPSGRQLGCKTSLKYGVLLDGMKFLRGGLGDESPVSPLQTSWGRPERFGGGMQIGSYHSCGQTRFVVEGGRGTPVDTQSRSGYHSV